MHKGSSDDVHAYMNLSLIEKLVSPKKNHNLNMLLCEGSLQIIASNRVAVGSRGKGRVARGEAGVVSTRETCALSIPCAWIALEWSDSGHGVVELGDAVSGGGGGDAIRPLACCKPSTALESS